MQKWLGLVVLAAVGCSELTVVGISGEDEAPPLKAAALRASTEIAALDGEWLMSPESALGDIDGDGHADFLLSGNQVDGFDRYERIVFTEETGTVYLFYGRPQFPERLVSSDADATFETGLGLGAVSLGDLNGDGLGDFALEDRDGFELIFGNPQRLTGHHAKLSTGSVVTYPATVIYEGLDGAAVDSVLRLGDLNGDGRDDFGVRVLEEDEHGNVYGYGVTDYLFEGREDGWPSGPWDPSAAVATLGYDADPDLGKQMIHHHGDLDGDGFGDLLTYGVDDHYHLYYGKPEGLRGTITASQADAEIVRRFGDAIMVLGDLDGDGADELTAATDNELKIVYGRAARYSGRFELQADLSFVEQGPFWGATLADVNGDGLQDLLVQANQDVRRIAESWAPIPEISLRLYTVLGTGQRLLGQQPKLDNEFRTVGYTAPAALTNGLGFGAAATGDIDGDGSTDLLLGVSSSEDPSDSLVYLLPGSMREPD